MKHSKIHEMNARCVFFQQLDDIYDIILSGLCNKPLKFLIVWHFCSKELDTAQEAVRAFVPQCTYWEKWQQNVNPKRLLRTSMRCEKQGHTIDF